MVVKSKDGKFPIVLDSPEQRVKETFRNGAEVEKFFKREVDLWQSLIGAVSNLQLFGTSVPSVAGYQVAQDAVSNSVEAGRRVESDASYVAALQRFDAERPILLCGKVGQLIFKREGETAHQTSGVLWAAGSMLGTKRLLQSGSGYVPPADVTALSYGQLKLANGLTRLRAERDNIGRIVGDLSAQVSEAAEINEATSRLFQTASNDLSSAISAHKAAIAELVGENDTNVKSSIESAKKAVTSSVYETTQTLAETLRTSTEEIEEFKRKVRIDVGLEEPTNFWTEKANGHRTVAIIFGVLFLLAVVGMVYWIDGYAVNLVSDAVDRIVGDRQAAALSLVPIAFITVPALAFAWVLRHLSRIMIQNLSLEADARLRGTITRTFKALAADRAMNDAELAIALQALFRPIDGKDHSEIAPPSLGDILKLGGDGKS